MKAFLAAFVGWHRHYLAHPDPAAAMANLVAVVIAWNGPLYPLYAIALIGWPGLWALLTMLGSPLFFAVPALMRLGSRAGRAALPLIGAVDTLWSVKLFGAESGVELFLLPCLVLTALLYRRGELWLMLPLLGLIAAAFFLPAGSLGLPIAALTPGEAGRLAALNLVSVAMLTAFLALQFAAALRRAEAAPRDGDGAAPGPL